MRLALYKGKGDFFDRLVRWWTISRYSHCEIVFSDGTFFSSSPRDGGVRFKVIEQDSQWDYINLTVPPVLEADVREYMKSFVGKKYDWLGLLLTKVFPLNIELVNRWFCSEICTIVLLRLGINITCFSTVYSPQELVDKLTLIGYKIEVV